MNKDKYYWPDGLVGHIKGIPLLEAFVEDDQYVVWCKRCNRNHFHSQLFGHRVAHCDNYPAGYFIASSDEASVLLPALDEATARELMMIECNPENLHHDFKPFHVDSAQKLVSKNLGRILHSGDCLPWVPIWIGYGSPVEVARKVEWLKELINRKSKP